MSNKNYKIKPDSFNFIIKGKSSAFAYVILQIFFFANNTYKLIMIHIPNFGKLLKNKTSRIMII